MIPVVGVVPATVFVVIFSVCLILLHPASYAMDPERADPPGIGTFLPHLKNYMATARLIVGLAAASIAAMGAYLESVGRTSPCRIETVRTHAAWPLSFFAWTIIYGVLFTGLLARSYEEYCHNPYSYTRLPYVRNTALGFSTLVCFAVGYVFFAWMLLKS
jgi:hypothetical protein